MSFSRFRLNIATPDDLEHQNPSLAYLPCPSRRGTRSAPCEHPGSDDSSTENNTTESRLCQLTISILDILSNTKDYSNPLLRKHISPNSIARKEHSPNSNPESSHEVLQTNAQVVHQMPDLHAEILSSVAKVQENGQKGEVWTWLRLSGLPVSEIAVKYGGEMVDRGEGICKECVCVMKWEKEGDEWMCGNINIVRGVFGV